MIRMMIMSSSRVWCLSLRWSRSSSTSPTHWFNFSFITLFNNNSIHHLYHFQINNGGKQDHTDLRVWRPCPINVSLSCPPLNNIRVMVIGGSEGILSELLRAGLCDTMFTARSTLKSSQDTFQRYPNYELMITFKW